MAPPDLRSAPADTGEIVSALSLAEARTVTDQIKVVVERAEQLIPYAYQGRAWIALGYSSWDDYCSQEFGEFRLKLPREKRQAVVASLRESGLSTRAISAATGISKGTITRESTAPNGAVNPEPADVLGIDGRMYRTKPPKVLTRAERRAIDIADGHKRSARAIERLTDLWPYFWSFHSGKDRAEIEAHFVQPTLDAIVAIEKQMRDCKREVTG